jgi:hypothetical protein
MLRACVGKGKPLNHVKNRRTPNEGDKRERERYYTINCVDEKKVTAGGIITPANAIIDSGVPFSKLKDKYLHLRRSTSEWLRLKFFEIFFVKKIIRIKRLF